VLVAISKGMRAVKLLQQNHPVLNWGCRLMQVVLYNGRKTVVVVVPGELGLASSPYVFFLHFFCKRTFREVARFHDPNAICVTTRKKKQKQKSQSKPLISTRENHPVASSFLNPLLDS